MSGVSSGAWMVAAALVGLAAFLASRPSDRELRPAGHQCALGADELGTGGVQGASTGGTGGLPAAGWYPDPSGRFHYRWWDGSQWTSHVATDGHHLIDTNPDQRIGPY